MDVNGDFYGKETHLNCSDAYNFGTNQNQTGYSVISKRKSLPKYWISTKHIKLFFVSQIFVFHFQDNFELSLYVYLFPAFQFDIIASRLFLHYFLSSILIFFFFHKLCGASADSIELETVCREGSSYDSSASCRL